MIHRSLLCLLPLCAALLLAIFPSCKKEAIDNTDQGYPLELTVEKLQRNIVLKWTETNVSNFENYVIVRSLTPIPDNPVPTGGILSTIEDYRMTTFEDATFPFIDVLYYKVYAKTGDRFLASPNIKFENDIKLLNLQTQRALFDPESQSVFLFDPNQGNVFKYNYATDQVTDTLSFPNAFNLRMALGDHGNGRELYIAPNTSQVVRIYNPDALDQQVTSMSVNGFVFSIASGNNDLLYLTTDNFQYNFSVYKRSTKQFRSGSSVFAGNESSAQVLSQDGLTVVYTIFSDVIKYTMNSAGQIISIESTFLPNSFFGFSGNIGVSNNGQFFIPDVLGTIFTKDLNVHVNLSSNNFFIFTDYVFSENDDRLWAFNTNPLEIRTFAFPSVVEEKRLPLNYQPIRAQLAGNDLIVVGSVIDGFGNARTIVDKLPRE